jgi:hypothetical protein
MARWRRDPEVLANLPRESMLDLAMTRDCRRPTGIETQKL